MRWHIPKPGPRSLSFLCNRINVTQVTDADRVSL